MGWKREWQVAGECAGKAAIDLANGLRRLRLQSAPISDAQARFAIHAEADFRANLEEWQQLAPRSARG